MRPIFALAAAAALAGCSQGGGAGVEPPTRKAGLWEQTLQGDQLPGPLVTRLCLDAASEGRAPMLGRRLRSGTCDKSSVTRGADGSFVADAVCLTGSGAKVTSHTVASGDFNAKYTVVSQRTIENAPDSDMDGKHSTTITAVYKGACPANIQPGQMQLPTGEIVEIGEGRRPGGGPRGGGSGGASGPPSQ